MQLQINCVCQKLYIKNHDTKEARFVMSIVNYMSNGVSFTIIAAELLKLVERAVLDPKKEGKPWLREGNFDWYIFKKSIHILLDTRRPTTKKRRKKRS